MVSQTADVVILGGGITGLSLAYYLTTAGIRRIVVMEQRQVGAGSTGRSVASLHVLPRSIESAKMYRRTRDIWHQFDEISGYSADYQEMPLLVFADKTQQPAMETVIANAKQADLDWQTLSPESLADLEPDFSIDNAPDQIFRSNDAGYVNPETVTMGYLQAAKQERVGIWENVRGVSILVRENEVYGVKTESGEVHAPVVVLATGAWTNDLLKPHGVVLPTLDHEQVVGVLDVPPNRPPLNHMVLDLPHAISYRFAMSNRYVFLPLNVSKTLTDSAMNMDPSIYISTMSDLRDAIVNHFPAMDRSVLQPGWSGLWNISPDREPIVGQTDVNGLWVSVGYGNNGLGWIPAFSEQLAQTITTSDDNTLTHFSPKRFT